jgi:Co/Zn/Cd efflux system component
MSRPTAARKLRIPVRVLGKILYWTAVLAISVALLIALVLFFESQDSSNLHSVILPFPG